MPNKLYIVFKVFRFSEITDHCSGIIYCKIFIAKCCRYFALPIEEPENWKDFEYIRWYLLHERATVFIEDDSWYLLVHTKCKHLGDDHLCQAYETRPQICRDYTTDNCEYHDDWTYDHYFETPEQIAKRNGNELNGLEGKLMSMWKRGLVFGVDFGTVKLFKMVPWVFGLYEFQLKYMTREFAALCEEYAEYFGHQFFGNGPQLMQVVPIEEEISTEHSQIALPYERISELIEKSQSFAVNDCICKKEKIYRKKR